MSNQPVIRNSVAVSDPNAPSHSIAPNSDGSINVIVTGGSGDTVTANQGTANAGGVQAWPVANTTATPAGSAIIGKVGIDQTTPGTTNGVQTLSGSVTTATLGAGSAIAGKVGIDQTTPGTTNGVQVVAALPAGTNVIGHAIIDSGSTTAATQTTAANLNAQVVGSVASGSSDSGNAVKTGAVYNSTLPTFTNGQRADTQCGPRGSQNMAIYGADAGGTSANGVAVVGFGNAQASTYLGLVTASHEQRYNGSTFDLVQTNQDTAALVSLSSQAAGTVNSSDQTNYTNRGVQVGVNLTTVTTATVTVTIQGKDAASGVYYTLLSSTGIVTTGFTLLTVYPGAPTTANASIPQVLPRTWRISVGVVGASAAVTGTIGASVIN